MTNIDDILQRNSRNDSRGKDNDKRKDVYTKFYRKTKTNIRKYRDVKMLEGNRSIKQKKRKSKSHKITSTRTCENAQNPMP